jgi:hypothetical protein
MTLALGEVLSGAALVTSLVLAVVGALLSYAVRQRDSDTERRLGHVEAMSVRLGQLETRAAVTEASLGHMREDIAAVRADVAELLRLARGGSGHE